MMAKLSGCDIDHMACKASNSIWLFTEQLVNPALEGDPADSLTTVYALTHMLGMFSTTL
jgi:hypothetical protein